MKFPRSLIRKPLFIIAAIWACFFSIMAIDFLVQTPDQMEKDKRFISQYLQPRIDFVQNFSDAAGRVPSQNEYIDYQLKRDPSRVDPANEESLRRFGSNEFFTAAEKDRLLDELADQINVQEMPYEGWIVSAWRGEWSEFYTSWDNRYYTNNWSWQSGIAQSLYCFIIGFGPLAIYFLVLFFRGKNKALLQNTV